MKSLFYAAIIFSMFSCRENSTSGEETAPGSETKTAETATEPAAERFDKIKDIEDIKAEQLEIISGIERGSMDSTSVKYNCNGEKTGRIIYYSENDRLRLIRHIYNEYSHFSATEEYFLKDEVPFFVFYKQVAWSFVNQDQTRDNITEKRFYIINNAPVKCLQKKFTVLSNDEDALSSDMVPNEEIQCSSLESIREDLELLFKFQNQKEDLSCLEE